MDSLFDDLFNLTTTTAGGCGGKCGGRCGPCGSDGSVPNRPPWYLGGPGIVDPPPGKHRLLGPPVRRLLTTNARPVTSNARLNPYQPWWISPPPRQVPKDSDPFSIFNPDGTFGAMVNLGVTDPPECPRGQVATNVGGAWRCMPEGYLGPPIRQTTTMTGSLCRTNGKPGIASGGRCYEIVAGHPLTHTGANYTGTVYTGDSTAVAATGTGGNGGGTGTGTGTITPAPVPTPGTIFGLSPIMLLAIGGGALLLLGGMGGESGRQR
jgi:hypothetical protein